MNRSLTLLLAVAAVCGSRLCAQEALKAAPQEPSAQPTEKVKKENPQLAPQGQHKRVEGRGTGGNSWFQVTDMDFGSHYSQDTVIGRFPFTNPLDKEVEWRGLQGSCQCTTAEITVGGERFRYSKKPNPGIRRVVMQGDQEREENVEVIKVPAGAAGEIEVHMELGGQPGPRSATLDIHTTDPQLPMVKLKWQATGAQVFLVSPQDVNLNQMVWNEKRDFTVTVQSPLQPDFTITGYDQTAAKDFTLSYDKAMSAEGVATWTIRGTYQPSSSEAVGGGQLRFYTDVAGQPQITVRVNAAILGPLEVKPGTFLALGRVKKGAKHIERIVFEPNDSTELDATTMKFENLTVDPKFVTAQKSKDGKKLVVELVIAEDAPSGLLRGDLVVELNHPAVPSKKILFNGFVR